MIRLFPITSLNYNILNELSTHEFFKKNKIGFTDDINKSDIFVARRFDDEVFKIIDSWLASQSIKTRPILIWTHEPRFCKTDQHIQDDIISAPIYNMNMYTKNVYFSNFSIYGSKIALKIPPMLDVSFSEKSICALATYVYEEKQRFVLNGIDIDLAIKRQNLIYDGYLKGKVDVFGRGWPKSIALSESRYDDRQMSKQKILQNYQFNICMENTSFPYYCSEKIWESIIGHCLPIYSSFNNAIYETFPEDSFIDYDKFENSQELYSYIDRLSKQDYLNRLNLCIDTFNRCYDEVDFEIEKQKSLEALVNKIRIIYDEPS
ncbi:hypothetical protein ABIE26_002525 [Pedobacter africanus]|uniref:Uncharacterized protein n=1 Tax=Pedobacter africanus TaxID=151894 RepID=A0ACC6KY37_9SPHI|nr:glycosyltransferase family 10 [Pedobacter africanus]MDR6784086.1 hypothetical protein [Pedobacter africanus]